MLKNIAKIQAIDLTQVKKKLMASYEHGGYQWPEQETDQAIDAYRAFLQAILEANALDEGANKLLPSQAVDIVWHTHILFTQQYHEDCQTIFGAYLHHHPQV